MAEKNGPPVPFSDLPLSKAHPSTKLNAWGAYGEQDELGFLNRQTDAVVAAAASEIKTGVRVSLNAALDFQGSRPFFGRQVFQKDVYQKKPRIVHDDTWHFNTQSASQWDGLRHYGYQAAQRFYNDTTVEDIAGTSSKAQSRSHILGIQNMERRGIVGRGILIDFARWRESGPGKDIPEATAFQSFQRTPIKLSWLKDVLEWQGTKVKFGDILIVRSGYFKAYYALNDAQTAELQAMHPPSLGGMEQSEEGLRWIWENFSAVAADHPSFEQWPSPHEWSFHEVLLAGWGCPIGELFELEELSRTCERLGRWSFFVTSEPVHVPGGVASPPNALAIF